MGALTNRIALTEEPDFWLGGLQVCPSTRWVRKGESVEVLQPRIMQVLVALAERRGQVVSHDELMARCWGGFAVSDDAIHRCIGRLRRLAEAHDGFRLETIPRVGYRLVEVRAPAAKRFSRVLMLAASLATGLLLVAAGFVGGHLL